MNTSQHLVHAFYGTPSVYTDAKLSNVRLPSRSDDMMPYADGPHAFWSGYFTSRTALKHYIRATSGYHQAVRQAQAFAARPVDLGPDNPLYKLERAQSVAQHHDAVAGTSKQAVAYDYAQRIAAGRSIADELLSTALNALTGVTAAGTPLPWVTCDLANATICAATEAALPGASILLALWNSQGQGTTAPAFISVGLHAGVTSWSVATLATPPATGVVAVPAQLIPISASDSALRLGYYNASAVPVARLAFLAPLPPAGFALFALTPAATSAAAPATSISTPVRFATGTHAAAGPSMTNGAVTISFSAATGRAASLTTKSGGFTPLVIDFLWYNSSVGGPDDGTDYDQHSGAYLFRPNTSSTFPVSTDPVALEMITGPIVNETRQVWGGGWASMAVRLWRGATSAELEWTVGAIPFADGLGKEVIVRYSSGLASQGVFFTDSNGRDSLRRVRGERPSWNFTTLEPVAGNYYPVNTFIHLSDESTNTSLCIVTDRSNGGSSLQDGSLELMVHRRLQSDDNRGVGEPLNETGVNGLGLIARGTHALMLSAAVDAGTARRTALGNALFPPVHAFAPAGTSGAAWLAAHGAAFSGLTSALPPNVHLLTLHAHSPSLFLVRLSHSYALGEDTALSTDATVSLGALFSPALVTVTAVVEMTLTANQPLANAQRVTYNVDDGSSITLPIIPPAPTAPAWAVTIEPLDIRTFFVSVA